MKDHFSEHPGQYEQYRPTYPAEFFAYLNTLLPNRQNAWDCGTGNGQVARELAKTFDQVYATDISQAQLDEAFQAANIRYSVQPAEKTSFADGLFDLIVVAQAIHWFDFERFYAEVARTAKPAALLCVLGYGLLEISGPIDRIIAHFYKNIVGPYWDPERRYIDEHYRTIPFPFREIQTPAFVHTLHWTPDHLIGYINTWSAVKHFIKANGHNPVDNLKDELAPHWSEGQKIEVRFPLLLRVGRVHDLSPRP